MSPKKSKEKELTLPEALDLARRELAPQWHLSKPLIAGVKNGDRVNVVPLDETFSKNDWVILFCDITDFSGEASLWLFKELIKRYQVFNLTPLIVIREAYRMFSDVKMATKLVDPAGITQIYVVDRDNLLASGFQMDRSPGVIVWKQNILRLQKSGPQWFDGLEIELQNLLRETDPGLPLWLPFGRELLPTQSMGKIEFGTRGGFQYPRPGFKPNEKGILSVEFLPTDLPGRTPYGEFKIRGRWLQDEDRISTTDPESLISLDVPSATLGLFAHHQGKDQMYGVIEVEMGDQPVPDVFAGPHLIYNDEGRSILRISRPGFYKVLTKLPNKERKIRFKFPQAQQTGVGLYGLRFAE